MKDKNEKINDEKFDADLNVGVGNKEAMALKPAKVQIMDLKLELMGKGDKQGRILVCSVKHPDAEKLIKISGMEWINAKNKKVESTGLWMNKDDEGQIQKGSALASFLVFNKVANISELMGKEIMTTLEGAYLVFKGY